MRHYRSLFHFFASSHGRRVFSKLTLSAYLVLFLATSVFGASWVIYQFNDRLQRSAEQCVDEKLANLCAKSNLGSIPTVHQAYQCVVLYGAVDHTRISPFILGLLKAHGERREVTVQGCAAEIRLETPSVLFIDPDLKLFGEYVSKDHGFLCLGAVFAMFAIFLFSKWLNWLFR